MTLTLSSESVRNTVFTDEHGLPMYKSTTPFRLGVRSTTISRHVASESRIEDPIEVVGRIDWHCFGSSIFTIGGMRLESSVFLPRHGLFGKKRTFTGPDGRRYRWDMYRRDVVLSVDDASRTEIARYHRATLGIIGKRRSASLEIAPHAEHMLDLIVLTFIYVEKLRMDKERQRRAAASSGGGP
ncbi:hypothetical protein JVT61DRAFT_7526 [Boletus reticuloceps]|uniref:DUF6593 domain-containing protein n=1 Tax=Boletus reticuloceps TaxID=495285 RepID=A0A8I2YHM4_9AGAM|nr:hypothetical protein JVT61DRAFT_7526 [Boletus reticuloceps]